MKSEKSTTKHSLALFQILSYFYKISKFAESLLKIPRFKNDLLFFNKRSLGHFNSACTSFATSSIALFQSLVSVS